MRRTVLALALLQFAVVAAAEPDPAMFRGGPAHRAARSGQPRPGLVLRHGFVVHESGEHLELEWRSRRLALLPLSETDFVLREGRARVRFVPDEQGAVVRLEWVRGGQTTPADRLTDADRR